MSYALRIINQIYEILSPQTKKALKYTGIGLGSIVGTAGAYYLHKHGLSSPRALPPPSLATHKHLYTHPTEMLKDFAAQQHSSPHASDISHSDPETTLYTPRTFPESPIQGPLPLEKEGNFQDHPSMNPYKGLPNLMTPEGQSRWLNTYIDPRFGHTKPT